LEAILAFERVRQRDKKHDKKLKINRGERFLLSVGELAKHSRSFGDEIHCRIPGADVVLTSQSGFPLLREQWVKRFKALILAACGR
jgi:hypothetical protein